MKTAHVDPNHRLADFDFEVRRGVLIIGRFYYDAFDTAGIVLGNQLVPKEEGHQPKEVKNFFHFNKVMRTQPCGAQKVHARSTFSFKKFVNFLTRTLDAPRPAIGGQPGPSICS